MSAAPIDFDQTVDPEDVARFSAIAEDWWSPTGPFAPLHRLNPTRVAYLRAAISHHFGRDAQTIRPLDGITLIDVGCGGGLICEPMRRLGATVTGLDAAERSIAIARAHAETQGLTIDYRAASAETVAENGALFDVVLSLEVIEHTADPSHFLKTLARLVKPGGIVILSTLNRTAKSYMMGIVGAEYILRWVPRGTHNWQQFMRPSEL